MAQSDEALARVPLLAGLKRRDLQRLAKTMKERTFEAGEDVVVEGRKGMGFFVITDGRAAVKVGGEVVSMLGPGDHFGEIALIRGDTRAATVTADTDLRCLGMTAWEFSPWAKQHPDVMWRLLESVVDRLRGAEARL